MEEEGNQEERNRQRIFIGCVIALVATAFYFGIRGQLLNEWSTLYNLSQEQVGYIQGAGLLPFAGTIILFSLVVDRIGYGVSMAIAFCLHIGSAVLTLCAPLVGSDYGTFVLIYVGTFTFALGNGAVEAVINPVVATMFPKEKPKYLTILHAGWPLGLIFGALLGILPMFLGEQLTDLLPGHLWVWRVSLMLIPMLLYGFLLFGEKFPVHERVEAGVSYIDMLREFGWGSAFIVFFLLSAAASQLMIVLNVIEPSVSIWMYILLAAVILTVPFGAYVKSFGRPLFVVLLLLMCLVASTELAGDSWMQNVIGAVEGGKAAAVFFAWMAFIMFVLRTWCSDIMSYLTPLGVLALSGLVACIGLLGISWAEGLALMFVVTTVYGFGKTFFWPAMLGIVGDRFPKGGALTLNAIAGVGMVFAGVIGTTGIGYVQDASIDSQLNKELSSERVQEITETKPGIFGPKRTVNNDVLGDQSEQVQDTVDNINTSAKQFSIRVLAILPVILMVCYLVLILYFRSVGGYGVVGLEDESDESTDHDEQV
jgi:MFS family permease